MNTAAPDRDARTEPLRPVGVQPASTQVLKVGGALVDDPVALDRLLEHLVERSRRGERLIVVHGGGKEIGELHERLGISFEKKGGLRITSEASMDLVTMTLCGLVNKRLVARLTAAGVDALGLCGADRGLLRSRVLNARRLGRVGNPPSVRVEVLDELLDRGLVVVLSPVSLGSDGALLNVNADAAAQAVAAAMEAERLDFVTDTDGVHTGAGTARTLAAEDLEPLVRSAHVTGGMVPKLQAALAAVQAGVERVRVGSLASLARGTATEVHA